MTLLGYLEDDEYLPEYGTVVVRDRHVPDPLAPLANDLLGELATEALSGTIATAGDGWLHGNAGDAYQAVRLEAHDTEPPADLANWQDVVETSFHSRAGAVSLGLLTGGEDDDALDLGSRGFFRARIAREAAVDGEEGDVWRIQFWPAENPAPPRWLKRTRPAVFPAEPGWQEALGYPVIEIAWSLTGFGVPRPDGWLDEPLPAPEPTTASACAQLDVLEPVSRRDAIPLLLATGLLTKRDNDYRLADDPPLATDRVRLPDALATRITAAAARARYVWLAADAVNVAAWQNPGHREGLAELLAVDEDVVTAVLDLAVSDRLLRIDGGELTALPRKPPTPVSVPMVHSVVRDEPGTVPGGPPRAGYVSEKGDVVVWRDDEPVTLGHVTAGYFDSVHETLAGIFVSGPGVLVRWDGTVERPPVPLGHGTVRSADGRLLGDVEFHTGRRLWQQVHLYDVVEGTAWSLPKTDGPGRRVHGIHDGVLYFSDKSAGFRWYPGEDPEPLGENLSQVDPITGTILTDRQVLTPDGTRFPATPPNAALLAPGGTLLYDFRHRPAALLLRALGSDVVVERVLPDYCETGTLVPHAPVWEDNETLLFCERYGQRIVRVRLGDDVLEHHELPESAGYRPFPVRPILGTDR